MSRQSITTEAKLREGKRKEEAKPNSGHFLPDENALKSNVQWKSLNSNSKNEMI